MKRVLFIILFIVFSYSANAQYTDIINSKRPGFSESPFGVGTNVYQFETGFFYKNNNSNLPFSSKNTVGSDLYFRTGQFMERLEFSGKFAYQNDQILYPWGINYHTFGPSEFTIGAKYLFYQPTYKDKAKEIRSWKRKMAFDKKRLIPAIGFYAGLNTNFVGHDYKESGMSYRAALLLQNDFSDRLNLITNLIADKISSPISNYSYIVTMTYAISENWSYFVENQGVYSKLNNPNYNFGAGLALLLSNNLQLDASARTNFFNNYSIFYASAGFAWRIDLHRDKITTNNSPDAALENAAKPRKKRNLFSRLFHKKH